MDEGEELLQQVVVYLGLEHFASHSSSQESPSFYLIFIHQCVPDGLSKLEKLRELFLFLECHSEGIPGVLGEIISSEKSLVASEGTVVLHELPLGHFCQFVHDFDLVISVDGDGLARFLERLDGLVEKFGVICVIIKGDSQYREFSPGRERAVPAVQPQSTISVCLAHLPLRFLNIVPYVNDMNYLRLLLCLAS